MTILLHICCAPCACYPVKKLQELGFEPTLYFFNPNIHPYSEFKRRLNAARQLADLWHLPLIEHNHYQLREFLDKVYPAHFDPANNDGFHPRCYLCYQWRIYNAAQFAAENNFNAFTTSLLYSKHQNHQLIKDISQRAAELHAVNFFYLDFRSGHQQGIELAAQAYLFRQNYCGCIFSEEERFSSDYRKLRKKFFKDVCHPLLQTPKSPTH